MSSAANIAAGGASLLGGIASGFFSSAQARRQMRFQERMANTAHQRQVRDLRLAGLNPILSAGGGGAPSPGGAMGQMQDPATPGVTSAIQAKRVRAEVNNLEEQNKLIRTQDEATAATADKTRTEDRYIEQQRLNAIIQARAIAAQADHSAAQAAATRLGMVGTSLTFPGLLRDAEIYSTEGGRRTRAFEKGLRPGLSDIWADWGSSALSNLRQRGAEQERRTRARNQQQRQQYRNQPRRRTPREFIRQWREKY